MINSLLNTVIPRRRSRLDDAMELFRRNPSLSDRLTPSQLQSAIRPVSRRTKRAARRTSAFVSAHPRGIGLGVGAAAAAAIGLYAFARLHESRSTDDADEQNAEN